MTRQIFLVIAVVFCLWSQEASAFWGSDSTDSNSGLNVTAGYDVNTITTISGNALSPPERKGQEQHTLMSVASPRGTVTAVLGPWWYWEKQTISIAKNQEVALTGSLAQGKDGALYIFAQRIENKSTGELVVLRSEAGKPLWTGTGTGNQSGTHLNGGNGPRSGAGNRGGGMRGGRR